MLKSSPGHSPATELTTGKQPARKPRTSKLVAAPTGDAVPGILTAPFAAVRAGDNLDQRESVARRAHRLRMKELFARNNTTS